jgi:hypothetical protein
MSRHIVSIILSLVIVTFLAAPTVIIMLDKKADVSFFYSSAEEEEKGHEKTKDVEVLFSDLKVNETYPMSSLTQNNLGYYFKTYPIPHLNLISPPPDYSIL